jgi:polar amino acid transport system substrate-binding protein
MTQDALSELTVPGTLRVGINLGNILLVTGTAPTGDPEGVAPDMAAALAERLGVAVSYVTYATPGEVADAAERDEWDVALIAVEPKRAELIAFCDPYCEIEATYLVPADSPFQSVEEVDRPGVRIAVSERAAYDLYLTRTLKHAELRRAKGLPGAVELFVTDKLDALAGLVPALKENAGKIPGARVLPGRYTAVKQCIGTRHGRPALNAVVQSFTAEAVQSGFVADLIDRHGVAGKLQVASGS